MLKKLTAVVALIVLVACVSAKEYKGNITKINTDKKTVTVKIDDADKTFSYTDKTEFVGRKGNTIPQDNLSKLADKIGERSAPATLTTDEKDGKEVTDKDGNAVLKNITLKGKKSQ
jgi:hypothetical protein